VECITHCHCISHLTTSLPPHFISRHSTSNPISDIFQTTPHSMSHHHSSPYHTFRITAPLAAHYSTLQYHISKSHHIALHPTFHITDVPHNATFHVLHATEYILATFISIAPPHRITPHFYTTLHSISHVPHLASFHHI